MDESIRQQQSCLAEQLGKEWHDDQKRKVERIDGPMILGAGPSGLATAACLREQGISYVMVDRADCVASLWQHRTYDRLKLHLPKSFCELPLMGFPRGYPAYPSRQQFIDYVVSYANHFDIRPRFNESVESAVYEKSAGVWRVTTLNLLSKSRTDYICRLLVVATGENSEAVTPHIEGLQSFKGSVIHVISYKTGADYKGQRVLVVGCGNSGMEVSLDLFNHGAKPFMVVRSSVHVLPREILGISSFAIATALAKWLPLWVVDKFLVLAAFLLIGDTERFGVGRPSIGPLQLKDETGQTPVLDIGAMEHIKSGGIKIVPAVERLTPGGAIFVDGRELEFDSVVLATGYKSSVPCWLKGCDFFTEAGMPKTPFPNGWKGDNGLYTVGFTRRGLLGASADARRIARDIAGQLSKNT